MFAPQNQEPDIIDAWSGTLQDWYDSIDNALTVSEIIPGNYEYSTATSYGNVSVVMGLVIALLDFVIQYGVDFLVGFNF